MTKAKVEEMLADLGYVILYIKEAQAQAAPGAGYGNLNRARELALKVGEQLKKELPKKAKMPEGRAWTDTRRRDVVTLASVDTQLSHLTKDEINKLYDITVDENENWDGEHVAPLQIVDLMGNRYTRYGLTPSRN